MLCLIWLFFAALGSWQKCRPKGLGVVADVVLRITGAMMAPFLFDALQINVQKYCCAPLFILGSGSTPVLVRLLIGRHSKRRSARALQALILMRNESRAVYLGERYALGGHVRMMAELPKG